MSKDQSDFFNEFQKYNPDTFDVVSIGAPPEMREFLANRLWKAHREGVDAGRQLERNRLKRSIIELLFGNE